MTSRIAAATAVTCTAVLGLTIPVAQASTPTVAAPPSAWSSVAGALAHTKNNQPLKTGATIEKGYLLNAAALTTSLADAPLEHTAAARKALPVITIPGADGLLHRFTVVDSPVMEPALAAKVAFRSYAATSVDEPGTTARLDYSPAIGFHATVRSPKGSWNVDPAYKADTTTYLAHTGDLTSTPAEKGISDEVSTAARNLTPNALPAPGALVTQRTYRLALANDPGYASTVGAANVDVVKAAVVNRTNEIYNDDLAIKLVLVGNNNLLDFNTQDQYTGADGPCGADACYTPTATDDLSTCTVEKITQTAAVIPQVIGRDNFDVGQILDNGGNGGVAYSSQVGQDELKGGGCSGAGSGNADFLAVEFFAHELGHQFGASHTFSSASCGGFNLATAVETGSGATIMSYAGTCAADDNIQAPSDPYFSQTSIKQMQTYINSTIDPADNGGEPVENGGTELLTADHSPVVTAPAASVIPVRTPFTLTGTVTDPDSGQVPVDVWEQDDTGTIRPLMDDNKTDGPLFRIFSQAADVPTYDSTYNSAGEHEATAADSTRNFPDLAQIAAGNTNAANGSCPAAIDPADPTSDEIECFAEFLPISARTLHFDLTARDRNVGGGGVTTAETVVTVAGNSPFAVTNAAASVAGSSSYTVTWNVAGTTAAPFGVGTVKISYSTDGGLTFPAVLSATTANDGSQSVTIPAGLTTTGRIKVEAIGQPFFDISHANLTVTAAPVTTPAVFTASTPPASGTVGNAYSYTYVATGNPAPTFAVASGSLPAGLTLNSTTGVLSGTPTTAGPSTFTVRATNGVGSPAVSASTTITITAVTTGTAPTISGTPANGVSGTAYTFQFTVAGSPTPTVTVSAGTLPAGLTLSSTGKLSGTPTVAGSYSFTVKATNSIGSATRPVTVTITAGPAKNVTVAAGNNQSAEVNKAFTTNLQAKVTDTAGNAKSGVLVTFKVTSGPAKFSNSTTVTATTGAGGIATAAVLTAGSTAGAVVVTATATGSTTATYNVTVKKTPTADLAFSVTGPSSAANNTTFLETIKGRNNGPDTATTTITTLQVPAGVSIFSAPGAKTVKINNTYYLVWNQPTMISGATVTYKATFKVNAATHNSVNITIAAASPVKDPNLANNASTHKIRLG